MTKSKRKLTPKAVLKLPDLPRSPFLANFRVADDSGSGGTRSAVNPAKAAMSCN